VDLAGPELASTISNTGACGMVGLSGTPPAEGPAGDTEDTRTDRQAVWCERHSRPPAGAQFEACLEERVPWGSVAETKAAAQAGVDGIIVQGSRPASQSTLSLLTLLQAVVGKTPMTLAIPFIFT
jgi:NAD(P)H-dependent flavin oxidoreductase YrpB (nitropropane dioxygenase family)